jgi:hypothetical protein
MSEVIEGGIYGEVEMDVANSLIINESESEPVEAAPSEPSGEEATVETETQETEQLSTTEEAPTIDELEIDGKSYSYDDIQAALEDSRNRHDWQSSNTQKAQELSTQRKALDAQSNKWKALNDDEELRETLTDYLGKDHALFQEDPVVEPSKELEQDTKSDEANDEMVGRLQELENRLEMQTAERQVQADIGELIADHPELDGQEDALREVIQTSIDKGLNNLEDAFIITNHQAAVDSAFAKAKKTLEEANEKKAIPEVSAKHSGERSVANTVPKSYDEARDQAMSYDLYE